MRRLFLLSVLACFGQELLAQKQVLKYQVVKQWVNDMVYDSASGRIIISIPSKDTARGNSIGYFNPDSGKLTNAFFVGSEPRPIALTDNAKYLYVGCDGSANVKQFDLTTNSIVRTFSMGALSFSGPRIAANISCQPGNDSTVAVALAVTTQSPPSVGVAVYRNGQKLKDTIPQYPNYINLVHFQNSSVLYGLNNSTTGYDFYTMAVDSNGVRKISSTGNLTGGSADFYLSGNLAYFDQGKVIDLSTSPPSAYGTFNLGTTWGYNRRKACYDAAQNLWCFAQHGFWTDSIYIERFNASNFLLKDVLIVGKVVNNPTRQVTRMIYLGDSSRYAISTTDGDLIVINGYRTDTSTSVGVQALPTAMELSVYPNPSTDLVHIPYPGKVYVEVFDVTGTLMISSKNAKNVSLRELSQGVYTISIRDEHGKLLSIQKVIRK